MGCCFFTCFTACKHRNRRHSVNATPSNHLEDGALKVNEPTKQKEVIKVPITPITKSNVREITDDEHLSCNEKKKVTFDLNEKTCEALSAEEETTNNVLENNDKNKKENKEEVPADNSKSISNLVTANVGSFPSNHSYQSCVNEKEFEDLDLADGDLNDESADDVRVLVQEESSESLFSLSIDSRKQVYGAEMGEKEVTSPMLKNGTALLEVKLETLGSDGDARDSSHCVVDSVLSPVENLTQWKVAKARPTMPFQHQEKENVNVEQDFDRSTSPDTGLKLFKKDAKDNANQKKLVDQEIAVDTSLSSWLATPPMSKGSANSVGNSPSGRASSPRSHEDRPILGALTIEDLKQLSAFNTPRRSRSPSPDETPIIGTVARYWFNTGRAMDSDTGSSSKGMSNTGSKNIEDERVKWNPIPFEERLESALEGGIA